MLRIYHYYYCDFHYFVIATIGAVVATWGTVRINRIYAWVEAATIGFVKSSKEIINISIYELVPDLIIRNIQWVYERHSVFKVYVGLSIEEEELVSC
jgi:hypothetical protein